MAVADQVSSPSGTQHQSGRWVVLAMFTFAATVTGTLYLYWNLHTAPFRPLQEALGREYKGSHPLVQGGQEKMHKGTPRILRIILRVDFDPNDPAQDDELERRTNRVLELAGEHQDLSKYDDLHVHFVWLRPEDQSIKRTMTVELSDSGEDKVPATVNE
jgi:hypothetical protein